MGALLPIGAGADALLTTRGESVAVAESAIGGLMSAALLSARGARRPAPVTAVGTPGPTP